MSSDPFMIVDRVRLRLFDFIATARRPFRRARTGVDASGVAWAWVGAGEAALGLTWLGPGRVWDAAVEYTRGPKKFWRPRAADAILKPGENVAKAKKAPAKAATKKQEISAEEQRILNEAREDEKRNAKHEARMAKAREEEAERRKPFAEYEGAIQKAVENCKGHLRELGDRDRVREALRRLTEQVRLVLPQTLKEKTLKKKTLKKK